MKSRAGWALAAAMTILAHGTAQAEIRIGAVLSLTGPAASLGIPEKNTVELLPKTFGGEPVRYIVLDDASDPVGAVKAARKLIEEEKVDAIIGPSTTPCSLALLEVIGPARTPMVSIAGSRVIASPTTGNRAWAYVLSITEDSMGTRIFQQMKDRGNRSVAFLGFNDSFGDSFVTEMKKVADKFDMRVATDERFGRNDTSVVAQALRVIAANPDAVVLAASGTPAVAPIVELRKRGYKGAIYSGQAIANADFLRVGGADIDGLLVAVGPIVAAEQLPDSNAIKAPALAYAKAYEGKYGPNSRTLFGAMAWDAGGLLERSSIEALKVAKPGTPEFRSALRHALEKTKDFAGSQAIYTMSPSDHNGTDLRSVILVDVRDGKWVAQGGTK